MEAKSQLSEEELTIGTGNAHWTIGINDKIYSDAFDCTGRIGLIWIILKEKNDSSFKINICGKELSEKDFNVSEKFSWELNQTTIEGFCTQDIGFSKGGFFEVQQPSHNIWRVVLWISQKERGTQKYCIVTTQEELSSVKELVTIQAPVGSLVVTPDQLKKENWGAIWDSFCKSSHNHESFIEWLTENYYPAITRSEQFGN